MGSLFVACRLSVAACGIFICSMQTLSCGVHDLVPWPRIEPGRPALGAQSLSHWASRKFPEPVFYTEPGWARRWERQRVPSPPETRATWGSNGQHHHPPPTPCRCCRGRPRWLHLINWVRRRWEEEEEERTDSFLQILSPGLALPFVLTFLLSIHSVRGMLAALRWNEKPSSDGTREWNTHSSF